MLIAIDLDNVLNNLTEQTIKVYNEQNNSCIKLEDITTYNFHECFSNDVADSLIELFKSKELWDSLQPTNDAKYVIKTLMDMGHRIIVPTATSPLNFQWKVDWMAKYYPLIDSDNIVRIMDKSLIKCDVMVDDCIENLTSNICNRIVIDYPWNRSESKDYVYDIYRAYNFKDVIEFIKQIERGEENWK